MESFKVANKTPAFPRDYEMHMVVTHTQCNNRGVRRLANSIQTLMKNSKRRAELRHDTKQASTFQAHVHISTSERLSKPQRAIIAFCCN